MDDFDRIRYTTAANYVGTISGEVSMKRQRSLFENSRLTLDQAIDLTAMSLNEYGQRYRHWSIAFSGGKDSTVLVSLICALIQQGKITRPESLTILMSDTLQEFSPIYLSALTILEQAKTHGAKIQIVKPALDERFFVYMFGRGVSPPSNVFRWCTRLLKAKPMNEAIERLSQEHGEEILSLTGVRQGESAARDQRISLSCSQNGGECGAGWFQNASRDSIVATLAPLLHWRVCNIEDYLVFYAPENGFDTSVICRVYGFGLDEDQAEAMALRTGCAGCPLVMEDAALKRILSLPEWGYLAPLGRLPVIYAKLKKPFNRLRQVGGRRKDGAYAAKQGRLGPLTMEARLWGLDQIKRVQDEINTEAQRLERPEYWLIRPEEESRVLELIEANTWPRGWTGQEALGGEQHGAVTRLADDLLAVQDGFEL